MDAMFRYHQRSLAIAFCFLFSIAELKAEMIWTEFDRIGSDSSRTDGFGGSRIQDTSGLGSTYFRPGIHWIQSQDGTLDELQVVLFSEQGAIPDWADTSWVIHVFNGYENSFKLHPWVGDHTIVGLRPFVSEFGRTGPNGSDFLTYHLTFSSISGVSDPAHFSEGSEYVLALVSDGGGVNYRLIATDPTIFGGERDVYARGEAPNIEIGPGFVDELGFGHKQFAASMTVISVPEPKALTLIGGSLLCLVFMRRSQGRQASR